MNDQVGEKRCGLFRRSPRDLRVNVLRDLFDGKKDWKDQAEVRVMENNFMGGDLKEVGSPQSCGRQRRTGFGRADPAEPTALQTSIQR